MIRDNCYINFCYRIEMFVTIGLSTLDLTKVTDSFSIVTIREQAKDSLDSPSVA